MKSTKVRGAVAGCVLGAASAAAAVASVASAGCSTTTIVQNTTDAGPGGGGGGTPLVSCDPRSFGSTPACTAPAACVDGLCLAPTTTTCRPSDGADDGCGDHAVCRSNGSQNVCYAVPDCPASGVCPVGPSGVACNDGTLATKATVCIPGRCFGNADCPESNACVRKKTSDVLGTCEQVFTLSLASNGAGAGWESIEGCEVTPRVLVGHAKQGAPCTDPVDCAPTCCSCAGGTGARLAAKCDLGPGQCASPAEACHDAYWGAQQTGVCVPP